MKLLFSLFIIVSLFFISAKSPIYATSVCGGGSKTCSIPTKTCTTSDGLGCNPSTSLDPTCGCTTKYNPTTIYCSDAAMSFCGVLDPCLGYGDNSPAPCYVVNDACTGNSQCGSNSRCCGGSPNYCSSNCYDCAGNYICAVATPTTAPIQCYGTCGTSANPGACTGGTYSWDGNGAGTTSCGNGSTPYCYNCIATPTTCSTTSSTEQCQGGSCITGWTQNSQTCNAGAVCCTKNTTAPTATPATAPHYACTGANNTCVVNLYGGYTTSNCNNACPAPTPGQICVPNSVISTACGTTPC